jgi:hypothetical protein
MLQYTPGSHVLAAAAAWWTGVDALRVVQPVMALAAGLKAGVVFLVARRALGGRRGAVVQAAAAPVLLLVPVAYFVRSIIGFGFYAQVVSEAFAAGLLLAIVAWSQERARVWLVVFAVCGAGSLLAWPMWVPAASAALVYVVIRARGIVAAIGELAIAIGPIVAAGLLHVATHRGGASILGSGGAVTTPSWAVLSAPFVVLAVGGAVVAARDRAASGVVVFAACALLQAIGLAALNRWAGSSSLYLPYKTVYLIVVPAAVLAAYALARLALHPARVRWPAATAAIVPVVVAVAVVWGRIPLARPRSPISESAYAAGVWARDHVPPACIDYFSRHWLTGYWLHLDVLGNPRASARMTEETFEFRDVAAKWIEGRGLPYGIVEDFASLPYQLRLDVDVLARFGPTAVVHRRRGTPGACPK